MERLNEKMQENQVQSLAHKHLVLAINNNTIINN